MTSCYRKWPLDRVLKTAACVIVATAAGAPVYAEEDASAPLQEIVVTARKRSERVQDVPMSITAIDSSTLRKLGAVEFADYATHVPNLAFASAHSGPVGSQELALRGIYGTGTVGFYIDDTPVPESMNPVISDVERIEVLRGPQGTLYGARSMGGTVRLITKQPDLTADSVELHSTVSHSNPGAFNYSIDGAANWMVAPGTAAVRLSAYTQSDSGMFDRVAGIAPQLPQSIVFNSYPTHHGVDDKTVDGIQFSALIRLSDRVTLRPRIAAQQLRIDGFPLADTSPDQFSQIRLFDLPEPGRENWQHYGLTLNADLDAGSIVSSTALLRRNFENREDYSEQAYLLFGQVLPASIHAINTTRRFVHETRFTSSFKGPLALTAGVFYSDTTDRRNFPADNTIPGIDALFGGAFGTDVIFSQLSDTKTKELAFFGELTWKFTDTLSATAGARWFDNKVTSTVDEFGIATSTDSFAGRQHETKVNPKLSIDWHVAPGKLVYASASEGFRIGGVNSFSSTLCANDIVAAGLTNESAKTFRSDSLKSYELGAKTTWLDRRLTLNGAAFHIDWSNVQQALSLASCGFLININAGKARSNGVELEGNWTALDALTLSGGLGYTSAKVTDNGGLAAIRTGAALQQVPKWTGNLAAEYHFSLLSHEGFARADWSYTGASLSANNDPVHPRERASYSIINLRTGVNVGRATLGLFVTNLTNSHANLSDIPPLALELPERPRIVVNRTRTVGLEGRWSF